ncbi:MAG: TIGR02391 family protein [Hyphomicrobium sp.]
MVNQVIKGDPSATLLRISDDKNEQDGYANILRGIVGAYRNPTHHHLLDHITREEALKVCAFIDRLLKIVDGAEVMKPRT